MRKTAILTGPTASGKSALASDFARTHPSIEFINADSLQVYRGMDIGTAKPSSDERREIPHHLLDLRDPSEPYTAGEFFRDAQAAILEIEDRGKRPLIVGGTGFYLKALLYGLWDTPKSDPDLRAELDQVSSEVLFQELQEKDPVSALRIGPNDRYRLIRAVEMIRLSGKTPTELDSGPKVQDPRLELLVIDRSSEELEKRIHERATQMLQLGFVEEVKTLRAKWPDARALQAVGYAQMLRYLDDVTPPGRKIKPGLPGVQEEIELATRQLVKSQRTWFRGQKAALRFELEGDREPLLQKLREIYEN